MARSNILVDRVEHTLKSSLRLLKVTTSASKITQILFIDLTTDFANKDSLTRINQNCPRNSATLYIYIHYIAILSSPQNLLHIQLK